MENILGLHGFISLIFKRLFMTSSHSFQIPELTRMGQTLKHVENLVWIISEDATHPTAQGLTNINRHFFKNKTLHLLLY